MSALAAALPGFVVRPMRPTDLDAVMAIETLIYPFPWTRGNFADSIAVGHDTWLFEEAAGGVAGYAVVMWLPDEVHLLNISVAPQRQRRGLGRAMLDWLCADAQARGALSMLLEVRPSNGPARALYASTGFVQLGVRRGYYPADLGTREDALVLRRTFCHG